jgi:DinB superfamily
MMDAVHRYEGTVNQVMGDGIMALFGTPLAHEDHAVRACYAALRMHESVAQYAEGVFRSHGVPLQARIGVIQRIQRTHGWLLKVTEDLPDEGLRRQFAATAPPASWHLWHIARWADRVQASFPNHPFGATWQWDHGRQIWFREELGGGWGLEPKALGILQTGAGMTDEAASAPVVPGPGEGLRAYARQVFEAVDALVVGLDAGSLNEGRNSIIELTTDEHTQAMSEAPGAETTIAADLAFHLSHASRHLGFHRPRWSRRFGS